MENNPFTQARKQFKTIGECADAIAEAFSSEADVTGSIILEFAFEKAKKQLPQRQEEWNSLMARVAASQEKEKASRPA